MTQLVELVQIARSACALVVDDAPGICEYLAVVLEEIGITVHCAHDVRRALEVASSDVALDVAFVDLNLPDRSGLELIAELRRLRPGLRVVIASGFAAMAKADALDSSTTELVLAKPYDERDISKVLVGLNLLRETPGGSANEGETRARNSEKALDRAPGHVPWV